MVGKSGVAVMVNERMLNLSGLNLSTISEVFDRKILKK
jgi:hypothetical protein